MKMRDMSTEMGMSACAGYIVSSGAEGSVVYGIGASKMQAQDDALRTCAISGVDIDVLWLWPASQALLTTVEREGGALDWAVRDDVAIRWGE